MKATVWVGRVKSTCPAELLQTAFSKVGRVLKVETGFAGFAFVEYESEDDADKAVESMNNAMISQVGEVRVQKATARGYQDACAKRDTYWHSRGPRIDPNLRFTRVVRDGSSSSRGRKRRSRSRHRRARSQSDGSQRSGSGSSKRSGSGSASQRSQAPARDKSASKPRSDKSKAQKSSSISSRWLGTETAPKKANAVLTPRNQPKSPRNEPKRPGRAEVKEEPVKEEPVVKTEPRDGSRPAEDAAEAPFLGLADRAHVVCFFDGASLPDLLLEGGSIVRVPENLLPNVLNGFPFGFQGLSMQDVLRLLAHLSAFYQGEPSRDDSPECAVEVRHKLAVDASGGRSVQKVLLVGGQEVCSEVQAITGSGPGLW
mmetsp:Transcript_63784/g.118490  ORF Transcript_63784/g.118490 Transcript_63784/m.118490 type:complete len:371 (+) Transcript_63784:212-1324(+)